MYNSTLRRPEQNGVTRSAPLAAHAIAIDSPRSHAIDTINLGSPSSTPAASPMSNPTLTRHVCDATRGGASSTCTPLEPSATRCRHPSLQEQESARSRRDHDADDARARVGREPRGAALFVTLVLQVAAVRQLLAGRLHEVRRLHVDGARQRAQMLADDGRGDDVGRGGLREVVGEGRGGEVGRRVLELEDGPERRVQVLRVEARHHLVAEDAVAHGHKPRPELHDLILHSGRQCRHDRAEHEWWVDSGDVELRGGQDHRRCGRVGNLWGYKGGENGIADTVDGFDHCSFQCSPLVTRSAFLRRNEIISAGLRRYGEPGWDL